MRRALALVLACTVMGACSSSDVSDPSSVVVTTQASTSALPSTTEATTVTSAGPESDTTGPATTDPVSTAGDTTEPSATPPSDSVTEGSATVDSATDDSVTPDSASDDSTPADPTATGPTATDPIPVDSVPADRPFDLFVPTTYDASEATPLVVLLHGYTASGDAQEAYFGLQPLAEERGFLYARPDGTFNAIGSRFWNATNACCGFNSSVDDAGYLMSLIHQVERDYNVDRKRIFLIGHSNGGFMSYRMACDHAETIAAIVSLAGATFADTSQCSPSEPVSVLEIHGTADQTILYDGGEIFGEAYPGAPVTAATWAGYDGCSPAPVPSADRLDIAAQIDGAETTVETFSGCPTGVDVELWTVADGPHVPPLTPEFGTGAIDFLFDHPKP